MDHSQKIGLPTAILHWLVALLMISQMSIGLLMVGEIYSLYPIHKSIGVLALLIILPRVVWRLKQGWPQPVHKGKAYEQKLAKIVHWVLIIATLLMPISGMLLSGASGHGFGIFEFITIVPSNHSSINPEEAIPYSKFWMNMGYGLHTWVGYILIGSIGLHVAGAFKHHIFDKDRTLMRMLGR